MTDHSPLVKLKWRVISKSLWDSVAYKNNNKKTLLMTEIFIAETHFLTYKGYGKLTIEII